MHEFPNTSDGFNFQVNPQVPPIIGSDSAPLIGRPDLEPPAEITAPPIPERLEPVSMAAGDQTPPGSDNSEPRHGSEQPPEDPRHNAEEQVAGHAGGLVTPGEFEALQPAASGQPAQAGDQPGATGETPHEAAEPSPEPAVELNPVAEEVGRLFNIASNFNSKNDHIRSLLMRGADQSRYADNTNITPPGEQAEPDTHMARFFRRFGLQLEYNHASYTMDIRVRDGHELVRHLQALPDGSVPESFVKGFQKLVDDFPGKTAIQLIHMDFEGARATEGLDIEGVLNTNTPQELTAYGQDATHEVSPGEGRAILQTMNYAEDITAQLARHGVSEDSLQEIKDMSRYFKEQKLTQWAVASELGLNADLDKKPLGETNWGHWHDPKQWDGAFDFLNHVRYTSQPGETFYPELVDKFEANLTRAIADIEQQTQEPDTTTSPVIVEGDAGSVEIPELEIPIEIITERIMGQQAYLGMLRHAQARLQAYKNN